MSTILRNISLTPAEVIAVRDALPFLNDGFWLTFKKLTGASPNYAMSVLSGRVVNEDGNCTFETIKKRRILFAANLINKKFSEMVEEIKKWEAAQQPDISAYDGVGMYENRA